jgi:hypothetical protein
VPSEDAMLWHVWYFTKVDERQVIGEGQTAADCISPLCLEPNKRERSKYLAMWGAA